MAEQLEFFAVPNPCVGVCESDARGFCRGCLRNRTERFDWEKMTNTQKHEVLRLCRQRKKRLQRTEEKTTPDTEWQQPSLFDEE